MAKRFRDLPNVEKARRIDQAVAKGRMSAETAAASRRFWKLPPATPRIPDVVRTRAAEQLLAPWEIPRTPAQPKKPPPRQVVPIKSGGRLVMVPGYRTPQQERAAERVEKAAQVVRAGRVLKGPTARASLAAGVPVERRKPLRREDVLPRRVEEKRPNFWSLDPRESLAAAGGAIKRDFKDYLAETSAGVRDIYHGVFSAEERKAFEDYWAETQATSVRGSQLVGEALARPAGRRTQVELQRMGLDEGAAQTAATVVSNFVRNVSEGAVGLPVGAAAIGIHPAQTTGQIAQFYADFYEPLARRDWKQFAKNLEENPDMALDWLGGLGIIAGGARRIGAASRAARAGEAAGAPYRAARAVVTGKEPLALASGRTTWGKRVVTRTHKVREGPLERPVDTGVQRYVPASAAGVLLSDAWAGFRTAFGGKGRVRKGVRESLEADRARLFGEISSYRAAAQRIDADPVLSLAFDRWAIYGGDASEARQSILQEVARREADPDEFQATQAQQVGLAQLRQAADVLENPPADLAESIDRGRVLANQTQGLLIGARVLNPRTAERMLNMPVKFLEDVPEVDHPVRTQIEDALRSTWRSDDPDTQAKFDQRIDLTMRWLDANAVSYSRRTGEPLGQFYDDYYADVAEVEHADIYDEMLDAEDDELLLQYGDPDAPFQITPERSRLHREANEQLQGLHGPEAQRKALARALPRHKGRITTIEQKAQRIIDQIPSLEERRRYARWYEDLWPQFGRFFGDDVENAVRTFLVSQAAMSPTDGVLAMLKMLEYYNVKGHWPPKGKLSHNTQAMVNAWKNANLGEDPAGVAAKIADFFGSAYGQQTRAWMQHMPNSGPGVVDRWTLRSDGFLDYKSYGSRGIAKLPRGAPNPNDLKRLKKMAKDEDLPVEQRDAAGAAALELKKRLDRYYDMSAGPQRFQYEWSSIRLNQLTDHLNAVKLDGRGDWTVDQVQALDWFATRREWGEMGGGWDDTWARNTYNIVGEITGDMRKQWLEEGVRGAIITDVTTNGSHGRVTILGTKTQAEALAKKIASETGRNAYSFYDAGAPSSGNRTLGIDIGGDPDHAFTVMRNVIGEEHDGLLLLPSGDGGLRIMFSDLDGVKAKNARKTRDQMLDDLREMGVEARPVASRMGVHRGAARPAHSLYRGDDPRGVLARGAAARRRRTDFRVSEVAGKGGARQFVRGLAANLRAWSLSPRAVEDFLEGGYRGFLTDDGNAGAAISPDGEIVSVFNSNSFAGAGGYVLVESLANGGYWLNAYDGFLPAYYANLGFREIARMKFADAYAPEGWNYKLGRPDVVFMAFDPTAPVRRSKRYLTDWDEAEKLTQAAGKRGMGKRSVESVLEELANRGDGMPVVREGQTLAQWKRVTKTTEEDPLIKGAVRLTDEGAELLVTPAADFSTLVHENAHAVLRGTLEWLRMSDDPRLEPVMRQLGIENLDAPYSLATQELFADAVETHAYMGSMPAPQLRRLLDQSSAMMKTVYSGIRQVAKGDTERADKIKGLLTDSSFSSLLEDLLDVTYGTQRRPDAIFMPRLPPTAPSRIQRARRYAARGFKSEPTPPRTTPVRKGSRGIRFEQMEHRTGPSVVADYANAAVRWDFARLVANEIYDSPFARSLERNPLSGRYELAEGHVPFVYAKAPQAMRFLDEQMGQGEREAAFFDLEPQELTEEVRQLAEDAFGPDVSPNLQALDDFSLEALVEDRQIVQIPDWIYAAYVDGMTGAALQGKLFQLVSREMGGLGKALTAPLSALNVFQRWNMVLKPAYSFTNMVGAMATATAHNPLWIGEIKKSIDHLSSWQPATLRILDEMVGAGSYELTRIIEEDTRGLSRLRKAETKGFEKITHAMTFPERRIRRAVAARQLRMAGYGDEADFLALVERAKTDTQARAIFNQIGRHAEDNMVRFRGQNAAEKMIIRRAFFVYGWLRASLRFTARFPLEHPVLAAVMNRVGNEGWDLLQKELERSIGFRGGIVQRMWDEGGERMARMIDLSSLFPFATGVQTARSVSAPAFTLADALGLDVQRPGTDEVSDMFSQGTVLGLALAVGEPPKTSMKKFLEGYLPSGGFAQLPAANWLARIIDPNTTETKTFGPRSRDEVLLTMFLGQLVPRDTKLDAAQETWLKQQPVGISAPIRVQRDMDTLLDRYSAAVEQRGDYENSAWTMAVQARGSYTLSSALRRREWAGLEQAERDQERAILKAKILQYYYPDVYANLKSRYGGAITEESVKGIEEAYSDWVSQPYSDMRSYITDQLGEEALK